MKGEMKGEMKKKKKEWKEGDIKHLDRMKRVRYV